MASGRSSGRVSSGRVCPPVVAEGGANAFSAVHEWWTRTVLQSNPLQSIVDNTQQAVRRSSLTIKSSLAGGRRSSNASPVKSSAKSPLDLSTLNPSLFVVGLEIVERFLPRYLTKAGIACERMQHAQLPVEVIRRVLQALFIVKECDEAEAGEGGGGLMQPEGPLREAFQLFDTSGDGTLDQDEFLAVLPLLGEDVPPEVVGKLFDRADSDNGGTIDGAEFVSFMRQANPAADDKPDGWRAFLPEQAAHYEEMVLLHVSSKGRARNGQPAKMWEVVQPHELSAVQRSTEQPYSMSLLIARADLANCEAIIAALRQLGWHDSEVRQVARALFVTGTDEDYAKVFNIFDRDATGGIDPFEFRAIMAVLGDHSTEVEARQLFLDADTDNDGVLDVTEFVMLLRSISPKARSPAEARMMQDEIARERLHGRLAQTAIARVAPEECDALMQVLVLGGTKAGKTYLLNQVLADKLPKGHTVAVGVGALTVRIGNDHVAVQVLDTPGDPRFAPLGTIFYPSVRYALLVFDATSYESFEALEPLLEAFVKAHPRLDIATHVCLVSNIARLGVKRAVSPGYAIEWCRKKGGFPYFDVEAEAPQGILDPLQTLADEYMMRHPVAGEAQATATTATASSSSIQEGGGGALQEEDAGEDEAEDWPVPPPQAGVSYGIGSSAAAPWEQAGGQRKSKVMFASRA